MDFERMLTDSKYFQKIIKESEKHYYEILRKNEERMRQMGDYQIGEISSLKLSDGWGNILASWVNPIKYKIKQVIFNNPATIIIWEDGTKTIVKLYNEEWDEEKAFAMAYLKKVFGGRNQYLKFIKDAQRPNKK